MGLFRCGGIVGRNDQYSGVSRSIIERCYNSGRIKNSSYAGGIIGYLFNPTGEITIKECYNKGEFLNNNSTLKGAIIGQEKHPSNVGTLNNLYYLESLGTVAIKGKENDTENKIMAVSDDINSYEEFITWIEGKI